MIIHYPHAHGMLDKLQMKPRRIVYRKKFNCHQGGSIPLHMFTPLRVISIPSRDPG